MKNHIKNVISLTAICAVVSILLALTNAITAPVIKEQENAAVNEMLSQVLPDGEGFEKLDISTFTLPETISEAYSEKNGGYVLKMITSGYGSNFVIMCGINAEGTVTGATCISSSETLGVETKYGENLVNATADTIDGVETVAGATKTTQAYKNAIKDALNAAVILGGGSVDIRTEEQILNDNLSEALPQGEGKFTFLFITEEIGEISAVYKADNDSGYVFVLGESFVGTDNNGIVLTQVDANLKANVESAAKKVIGSTMTEIDITGFADMPTHIEKAYKTTSGNYVFELRAAGYGINGDKYTKSGEYILIRASVTPAGKIIACQTISQKESEGFGDACAKPSFYNQFNGKTEGDYGDVDAISGATITTNGYKTAISKVFEAVKILKGDAK